jgi:S-adenosylmethionine hydrolase
MPTARAKPPIAILTDFGYRDHYVGAMKGVIAQIAPAAPIIDLTHGIPAQSVIAGAIALEQSWRFFPKRTIFLAVVDPGVGTRRLPIAIETRAGACFVGPDNGLLWMAANAGGIVRAVELRAPRYRLAGVSSTFHGRDIFAPAAAHLWSGVALRALGPAVKELERLSIDAPERVGDALAGRIVYVDGFGNLVSNISREAVERLAASFRRRKLLVRIGASAEMEILKAYGDAPVGAQLATFGSFELLEIAVRDGSAASFFGAGAGARVSVIVSE